ncbi:MAG TPA: hypothetical protein VHS06_10385, partial [Chloroflexota bacterium]|nr:hypothetical protein [Chloroflexota bacterium]
EGGKRPLTEFPRLRLTWRGCCTEEVRTESFRGENFSPTMVYQFKQVLWQAGILATKADRNAGKDAGSYRPDDDVWALELRLILRA